MPNTNSEFHTSQKFKFSKNKVTREIVLGKKIFKSSFKRTDGIKDAATNYLVSYLNNNNQIEKNPNGKKLTYIDLFCGGGGFSLGVHQALSQFGINARLLAAVDIDKAALTLTAHHFNPIIVYSKSVEEIVKYSVDLTGELKDFITKPKIVNSQFAQFKGKVDLLVGGPPCQGHSNLNNRTRRSDPRNFLYFIMPAVSIALEIPCVIIENVKSIKYASENVVEITKGIFESHKYFVEEFIIDATDFGVAQTRKRHFLVASKIAKPDVAQYVDILKSSKLSFDDINTNLPIEHNLPNRLEETSELSKENQERIKYLFQNNLFELPNTERPDCHKNGNSYPAVYGRLRGGKPLKTITTGFGTPGRGRFIHPHEPRVINIREAARAQSFPDWYFAPADELNLTRNNLYKIIGDAVPSMMVFPLISGLLNSFNQKLP